MDNIDNTISCKCGCGEFIGDFDMMTLIPCSHLMHVKCKNLLKNRSCPICKKYVTQVITFQTLVRQIHQGNKKYYQNYVDMLSVSHKYPQGTPNFFRLAYRSPFLLESLIRLSNINSRHQMNSLIKLLIDTCGIKIKIIGDHNYYKGKKVLICNHSTYLDPIPIYKVFKCGFLGSAIVNHIWPINKSLDQLPILIVNRGKNENTVDRMKKWIETNGDLCLFPEGMITHPKTLSTFRRGAFHVGYPIQPIVMTYDPYIYDPDFTNFGTKILSQGQINVTIRILPIQYPPFTNDHIIHIRDMMAKAGDFGLSRISNRSLKD